MHEQFPNSGKTSALQVAAERVDRTGGAHSDPIDSDRDNDHVRELATSSDAALEAPVAPGPPPRLAAVIVLIVAIVVTAALLGLSYEPAESVATTRAPAALSGHPSIAVLPFLNRGNDPRQKDFAQGISEDLATDLSKLSRLHVISSDSLASERRWMSMQHVAHELGVRYLLHGSVRRAGDRVRINAKLIDATAGRLIWANRYDGTLADVFAFQDGVTKRIVAALAVTLSPEEEAGLYSGSPDETHGSVRNGLPPGKKQ